MRYRVFAAGLIIASVALAQDTPPDPALARRLTVGWATGVAGRFVTVSNPVVSAHSLARLAALTCEYDRNAASGMMRQAITRLNAIPANIFFDEQVPRLPIASFTGLWKMISASVKKCDPSLTGLIDTQAFELRRNDERRNANSSVIARALNLHEEDPERAAQLGDLMLDASDPASIDFGGLEFFLVKLRERAPELADDVFRHALETIVSAPSPGMLDLDELGKYLFVDPYPDHVPRPDVLNLFRSFGIGGVSVYDFRHVRMGANPDVISAYIDALRKMVEQSLTSPAVSPANSRYEPTVAYSLTLQLSAHARELDLESANALTELLPKISTSYAAFIAATLRADPPPIVDERANRRQRVRAIVAAIRRKRFEDARREMNSVGDEPTTRQLSLLIDFAEASAALSRGDIEAAIRLTNRIQPGGVKRGMLYASLISKVPAPQHESYVSLGARDAQSLPPEFRAAVFSALSVALLEQKNPERAYTLMKEIVEALNEARVNPRQGRFDPRRLRGIKSESTQGASSTTDVPSIPLGINRFYMVIDTGENRLNYEIAVPGVTVFSLAETLKQAEALDPQQLESLILSVRDEAKQADAYLAIAELRFKKVGAEA